jgi:hypothetical protein
MLTRTTIELNKIFPLLTDKNEIANLKNSVRKKWHVFEILIRNTTMFYCEFYKEQK